MVKFLLLTRALVKALGGVITYAGIVRITAALLSSGILTNKRLAMTALAAAVVSRVLPKDTPDNVRAAIELAAAHAASMAVVRTNPVDTPSARFILRGFILDLKREPYVWHALSAIYTTVVLGAFHAYILRPSKIVWVRMLMWFDVAHVVATQRRLPPQIPEPTPCPPGHFNC